MRKANQNSVIPAINDLKIVVDENLVQIALLYFPERSVLAERDLICHDLQSVEQEVGAEARSQGQYPLRFLGELMLQPAAHKR